MNLLLIWSDFPRRVFVGSCVLVLMHGLLVPSGAVSAQSPEARVEAAVVDLREALRADTPAQAIGRAEAALRVFDQVIDDPAAENWPRTRARQDRLVALNLLGRHANVVEAVRDLRAEGVELPAYVLGNEADALAALREPEQAVQRYRDALRLAPDDRAWVLGLAYALIDLDRLDEARRVLASLAATPGDEGRGARQLSAMLRAWSGWSDDAAKTLGIEAGAAPEDQGLGRQRADLERLRGRPRASLALLDGYDSAGASISRAQALDQWGDSGAASAEWERLEAEAEAWWPLRRALAERARDRRASVESRVRAARGGDLQLASGEVRAEITAWTPVLHDHWRAFAAYRRGYADFRGAYLEDQRLAIGGRYVGPGWRLQGELNRPLDRYDDGLGWALAAEARLSDDWSVAADAAARAFDLPLRARGGGITGDRYGLALRFSPIAQGFLRAGLGRVDYSDGNRRQEWSFGGSYRWPLTWWSGLSVSPSLSGGTNRRSDGPYFSPLRDQSMDVALAWDNRFWARLSERHRQRVEVFAGRYRQDGFGGAAIGGVRYEYRYDWHQRGSAYVRAGRDKRAYDGRPEFQTFLEVGVSYAIGNR